MLINSQRQWVTYFDESVASEDFAELGAAFEDEPDVVKISSIGNAVVRVMRQRALIDYAVGWMEANRPASLLR